MNTCITGGRLKAAITVLLPVVLSNQADSNRLIVTIHRSKTSFSYSSLERNG